MAPGGRGGARGDAAPRGKARKPKRGGGKHFSRGLGRGGEDGEAGIWADPVSDKESSGEESEEEESSGNEGPSEAAPVSREERKAVAKARKEAAAARKAAAEVNPGSLPPSEDEEEETVKKITKPLGNLNLSNPNRRRNDDEEEEEPQLSRKEKEALEAAAAKERYRKLHEAGKTDEAKADMARLKKIREERELARLRRLELEEERKAEMESKLAQSNRKDTAPAPGTKKGGKRK